MSTRRNEDAADTAFGRPWRGRGFRSVPTPLRGSDLTSPKAQRGLKGCPSAYRASSIAATQLPECPQ